MASNKCKHLNKHTELRNNNSVSWEEGHFCGMVGTQIIKNPTIISYCADCGKKLKEVTEE